MSYPSLSCGPTKVHAASNPAFVSYPASSERRLLTAQTLVLIGLTHAEVGPMDDGPLVAMALIPTSGSSLRTSLTKKYGKRSLRLDMGNDPRHLKEVLTPSKSYLLSPSLLNHRVVDLDEAYLHLTLSSWNGRDELERMLVSSSAMASTPCLGFSVNFNERRQKSLGADIPGAFRKLRNELSLLNILGPYMVTLERDGHGRLHLHGLIATTTTETDLKDVLRQLGGFSPNVRFRNCFQVKVKQAFSPLCWTHYMLKEVVNMPASERGDWVHMSRKAASLGERDLPALIDLARRKLGVQPEWRGRAAVYAHSGFLVAPPLTGSRTLH